MGVEFRCSQCGTLLSAQAEPGTAVTCPQCGQAVEVPAAAPQPPTPSQTGQAAVQPPEPPPETAQAETVMSVMAGAMPWVISVLFHLGLFLIMVFVTIVVLQSNIAEDVLVPDAMWSETPGGQMRQVESAVTKTRQTARTVQRRHRTETKVSGKRTRTHSSVIARGGATRGGGTFWKTGLPAASGPRSKFLGTGGNAYHVVYVVDWSGSMVDIYEQVRHEMVLSIGKLREFQDFHVILFGATGPIEYGPKALVLATTNHKTGVAEFLRSVVPEQATRPLPAIRRAFAVLKHADPRKRGKLIHLLTDAEFPDNEAVLETIRQLNKDKSVVIHTFLYGRRPPGTEEVMRTIARESGGRYKHVSPDE